LSSSKGKDARESMNNSTYYSSLSIYIMPCMK
jgi:hypothetical protein